MRRSILTEKVSRRGYHLSREYSVDPFEILVVRDVMQTKVLAFPASMTVNSLLSKISANPHRQRLYPVVDDRERLIGVVTRGDVHDWADKHPQGDVPLVELARAHTVSTYPDEPLRIAADRMAATGLTRLPVVDRNDPGRLVGMLTLNDLLTARARCLDDEQRRERVISMRLRFPLPLRKARAVAAMANSEPTAAHAWHHVRGHHWNPANHGFNASNAKMVCMKCHRHLPFEMNCEICGGADFELGTALDAPAIFCRTCHEGQMHWDCPACGHRQGFARGFYYDENAVKLIYPAA
jgi:CBS domain-containing protein